MPKRLPEGIRQLNSGRYQARYTVTINGRVVQRSAGTFATLQDAKDARSLAIAQRKQGTWVDPTGPRMTVRAWSVKWQTLRNQHSVRTRSFLKMHILPVFGEQRLGDLTPVDVQDWVRSLERKGLSTATILPIYQLFKRMMSDAVDMDVLPKSPCRAIQTPKLRRSRPTALTVQQVRRLEACAPPRYAAMVHLSAWAGLRWQEAAALRWENVDLAAGLLNICEAIKSETKQIGLPKGNKTRLVPISPTTVARLQAHRRDFGDRELVFTGRFGQRLDYGSYRENVWYPMCERAGLTGPRPSTHDLRHFYATTMTEFGIDPKVLSETMGHYDAAFTMSRYGLPRADGATVLINAAERAMQG
jgi:integrase